MFTGIVADIGRVSEAEETAKGRRFVIETGLPTKDIVLGASIACNGVCLTVEHKDGKSFSVFASKETLDCTTLASWQVGTHVNLERALCMGDELGGHMVTGHVDAVVKLDSLQEEGESWRLRFTMPDNLAPYIAAKGSITLDGVSLTVNDVDDNTKSFGVNIIPHTYEHTIVQYYQQGSQVNLEIDVLARYIARAKQVTDL